MTGRPLSCPLKQDQSTQMMQICQDPKPRGLKARVQYRFILLPPSSHQVRALQAHKGYTCTQGRGACGKRVYPLPPPLPLHSSPPFTPCWKVRCEFFLLVLVIWPEWWQVWKVQAQSDSSSSRTTIQEHLLSRAPIHSSVTLLCPSDTSGVPLQRLHKHTHTLALTMHPRSHIHNHAQTNPHTWTHVSQMEQSWIKGTCLYNGENISAFMSRQPASNFTSEHPKIQVWNLLGVVGNYSMFLYINDPRVCISPSEAKPVIFLFRSNFFQNGTDIGETIPYHVQNTQYKHIHADTHALSHNTNPAPLRRQHRP